MPIYQMGDVKLAAARCRDADAQEMKNVIDGVSAPGFWSP